MKEVLMRSFLLNSTLMLMASGLAATNFSSYLPKTTVNFKPPRGSKYEFENGLTLYIFKDNSLPMINITALVKTGRIYDPPEKVGVAQLTAAMLKSGGTSKYSPEEIDKTLDFLGAEINSKIGFENADVYMQCMKKDFDGIFDIYADMLMNPSFDSRRFSLEKSQFIENIRRRNDKPQQEAVREAFRAFYGKNHPYGWRPEMENVGKISVSDLKKFHSAYYRPNNTILAVSGDFRDEKSFVGKIREKFASWKEAKISYPEIPPVKTPLKRKIYLIDKPVAQTYIVMLQRGIKRHDDREFPLSVAHEILGGGLSSRLAVEIRSRRGLAYTVYSYFGKRPDYGFQLAFCGTKPQSYAEALEQMIAAFDKMKNEPVGKEELENAKQSIINSFVFRFPTPFDLIYERASFKLYGYPDNYLDSYTGRIEAVSAADVLKTAKELFDTDKAAVLILGDSTKFTRPLSDFGEVIKLKE